MPKKFVQDKWAILCPKMAYADNSGSALTILLKFCKTKRANRYMKTLLFFKKKISFGAIWFFLSWGRFLLFHWAWLKFSRVTVIIGSLNSQDIITFMINDGSLNSCRCLYVEVKIYGYVKFLLRICYVSLFECKVPWMLKTDISIF